MAQTGLETRVRNTALLLQKQHRHQTRACGGWIATQVLQSLLSGSGAQLWTQRFAQTLNGRKTGSELQMCCCCNWLVEL